MISSGGRSRTTDIARKTPAVDFPDVIGVALPMAAGRLGFGTGSSGVVDNPARAGILIPH